MNSPMNLFGSLIAAAALSTPSVLFATPVTFADHDVSAKSLADAPKSMAAAAAFDTAVGAVPIINFDTTTFGNGVHSTYTNIVDATACTPALGGALDCGYNTTVGGSKFLLDLPTSQFNGIVTFSFDTPVDAFGAYFTGWDSNGHNLTYTTIGGATVSLPMPPGGPSNSVGGTAFFGFIDPGASITSVTFNAMGVFVKEAVSIDDIRYRPLASLPPAPVPVPEPGTLTIAGLGALAIGLYRHKRRQQTLF